MKWLDRLRAKKKIERIRKSWNKPKNDYFDFPRISSYANNIKTDEFHRLSEQTISDIDFYGVFKFIDRTTSKVGQQYLFKKLIEPTNKTTNNSETLIQLFTDNANLREEVQLQLLKLNSHNSYYIPSLIGNTLLIKPKWFNLLYVDVAIMICLLLLSIKFQVFLIVLIVQMTVNIYLHLWNKNNTFQFVKSIPQLSLLIDVSKILLKKKEQLYDRSVEESAVKLRSFQQKAYLISFDLDNSIQSELTQIGTYILELIKAFFLIEIFTLFKVVKEIEHKQSSIIRLFNYVGNIDAAISVAAIRTGALKTCQPAFVSKQKELRVKNIYHPLIENCIKNDLTINEKSILITGSNMSGKSTFLRTLMINSILAQTIYTCFADEFISPVLKQFSAIRIDDNLFEGKSYYFQEVSVMASLINEVTSPFQNLFVLDEIFKGTNTVERIASGKSILSYLNQNENIVIISTHDIELSDLLKNEYDLYHFTETIENDELHFDHKIKSGQLKTRNAIKLLELSNYPAAIVKEAGEISSSLTTYKIK